LVVARTLTAGLLEAVLAALPRRLKGQRAAIGRSSDDADAEAPRAEGVDEEQRARGDRDLSVQAGLFDWICRKPCRIS
jgi:hypothetical protein